MKQHLYYYIETTSILLHYLFKMLNNSIFNSKRIYYFMCMVCFGMGIGHWVGTNRSHASAEIAYHTSKYCIRFPIHILYI